MRHRPSLLVFGLFVIICAPVASGASTANTTFTATIAEASWESYSPDTGQGEYGGVQFAREGGETYVVFQRTVGKVVLCEGDATPDDPTDDYYGFVGKETFGIGPARLSIGRQYTTATGSATLVVEVGTVNDCTGEYGIPQERTVKVSLSAVAVSTLIKETSRSIISVPSDLTAHSQVRGSYRRAASTVRIGTAVIDADGIIGQLTFREHQTVH